MKTHLCHLAVVFVLSTILLCLPVGTEGQESSSLEVAVAAICQEVVEREPVDAGISFPASVGRLYCFTKIAGAQDETQVTHVWYYGSAERARIDLNVKSDSWRTFSSKSIQGHEIGSWRVNVLDAAGTVLKELQFEISQ
jgi:hypothetical protein